MKPSLTLGRAWVILPLVLSVAMPTVSGRHTGKDSKKLEALKKKLHEANLDSLFDEDHQVKMGIPNLICDDGKYHIEVDWAENSTTEMHCNIFENMDLQFYAEPVFVTEEEHGESLHICFPDSIKYNTTLPLSGPHRPLWPKFGEYKYLPPQRWVHSLEHGAIVFLYHPCVAEEDLTLALKKLLRGCLWKHAISPYRLIPDDMPYALVAYGNAVLLGHDLTGGSENRLQMAKNFIKDYAFKASETHVTDNGQYSAGLEIPAEPLTKAPNDILCE